MIKLIASDLDGTLLHGHRSIREEDKQSLHHAKAQGIGIAIASGRMLPEINRLIESMDLSAHAVSQNGAYVHLADGTLVKHTAFQRDLIMDLTGAAAGTHFVTLLAGPDSYIVQELDDRALLLQKRLLAPIVEVRDLHMLLGRELICGKISYMGDVDALRELQRELQAVYGDAIDAYISDVDCLDVMPRGTSKGTGLTALLHRLELHPEETICIGDSFNDVSMFSIMPHSFAMASSHPDVQSYAAHTVNSVTESLRWAFEHNAAMK